MCIKSGNHVNRFITRTANMSYGPGYMVTKIVNSFSNDVLNLHGVWELSLNQATLLTESD